MGIQGLTAAVRSLRVGKPTSALANGTMFIDGHSMSHAIARLGMVGARYDCRGVSLAMEKVMNEWLKSGWKIEMVLFDGLTPKDKFGEIRRRTKDRIKDAVSAQGLEIAAASASICYTTLRDKFPGVNVKIAPAETDDILAAMVWNYALTHLDTPTYLLTADSDFFAFDFPENVTVVNSSDTGKAKMKTLEVTKQVTKKYKMAPTALAWLVKGPYPITPAVMSNPHYLEYAAKKMRILQNHKIATHEEYVNDATMMHAYHVLGNNADPGAHRVVNSLVASDELYMFNPIMCEPEASECSFDAGRRWRSLAYEVIAQKQGSQQKQLYLSEYGRQGRDMEERKIPISDGSREQNDRLEKYQYGSKQALEKEIGSWKTRKDVIEAIWKETALTTPSGDGLLRYSQEITEHAARKYLTETVNSVGRRRTRGDIYYRLRGKTMTPTSLRIYNKFLACVMSLRLLESAGYNLPVTVELTDMDGARWREVVLNTSSPNHKKIEVRKNINPKKKKSPSPANLGELADQLSSMNITPRAT